jgi:predicted RNA-binding Zn-ribbon protein involved in translation (DUF1610 family)
MWEIPMADQGTFACDQCGKQYKWKPEFAGRKVKCKCGYVMSAPANAPTAKKVAVPEDDGPNLDALYDLADEGQQAASSAPAMIRCPHCRNEMEPGLGSCPSCGFNLKTGARPSRKAQAAPTTFASAAGGGGGGAAVMSPGGAPSLAAAGGAFAAFGAPRKRGEDLKVPRNDALVDWFIPVGLLAAGMVLGVLKYTTYSFEVYALPQALLQVGLVLVLSFVMMAVAAIFMIQWGEIAFGDPAQAAIKIAAAVTAPVFIANIISYFIHDAPPTGWGLVGFFLAFGMFFVFYHYMFEWDLSEKWVVVAVTTVVTMLAVPMIMVFIANGGHLPQTKPSDDSEISRMQEFGRTKDANAWFNESGFGGRIFGDVGRRDCDEFLKDLYNLGAKQVQVVPDGPKAAEMYIEFPKDTKRRKAIVDYCDQWMTKHKGGHVKDKGGKWLMLIFFFTQHPPEV